MRIFEGRTLAEREVSLTNNSNKRTFALGNAEVYQGQLLVKLGFAYRSGIFLGWQTFG